MTLPLAALVGAQCGNPFVGPSIRKDVLECEEAVQHAQNCCHKTVTVSCIYQGCEGQPNFPNIPPDYAYQLRTTSCEELVATGFCADPQRYIDGAYGLPGTSPPVDMRPQPSTDLSSPASADMSPDLR